MKRLFVFIILAAFAVSCGNGKSGKNSSGFATVKMNGVWKGVLPAADCSGIEYILKLEPQGTYDLTAVLLRKMRGTRAQLLPRSGGSVKER